MNLGVSMKREPRSVRLILAGDLDGYTWPRLREAFADAGLFGELIRRAGRGRLLIDLSRLSFLDSIGAGALLRAFRSLTLAGARPRLVGAHGAVRETLARLGLGPLLREDLADSA